MQPGNYQLSTKYERGGHQWVACVGGTDTDTDKKAWIGRILEDRVDSSGLTQLYVMWLERKPDKKFILYHLCQRTPKNWIPIDSVILFGISVGMLVDRNSKEQLFDVKTPTKFINKMWKSSNKQETFDELVKPATDDPQIDMRKKNLLTTMFGLLSRRCLTTYIKLR